MKNGFLGALSLALVVLPEVSHACTVCTGGADQKIGPAMNGAIFFMLGCIGSMLAFITTVGIVLVRRSHAMPAPHSELLRPS